MPTTHDADYVELSFSVPDVEMGPEVMAKDLWVAALFEAGALGVEERDAGTLARSAPGTSTLVAWVAPDDLERFLGTVAQVSAGLPEAPLAQLTRRNEAEWRDVWKQYFSARHVGRFVIVPSWERYTAAPGELVIDMDPGRAFGTGNHASTQLCLLALGELEAAPARVLDIGCGSGVLSVAAGRRFAAARLVASDIDEDAHEVTRENAARNQVTVTTAAAAAIEGVFDLVLANIQPEVLIPMAPTLARRVAPGGTLLLSGILFAEAAAEVRAAYVAEGLLAAGEERELDGWRLVTMRAPGPG